MAGGKKHEKRQKTRTGLLTRIVLLLLLVGVGWQLVHLREQVQQAETQKTQLSAKVEQQRQENAALAEDIENGASQEQLEEIARDELGMVSPGEKVFYDVSN